MATCLNVEEVDEGLLFYQTLVVLGEQELLEQELGPPVPYPELRTRVCGCLDFRDLSVFVEEKVSSALNLVQSEGIGFTDAEAVFHLQRRRGRLSTAGPTPILPARLAHLLQQLTNKHGVRRFKKLVGSVEEVDFHGAFWRRRFNRGLRGAGWAGSARITLGSRSIAMKCGSPTLLRLLRLAKDQVRCCGASVLPLEPTRLAPSISTAEMANMPLDSSESAYMDGLACAAALQMFRTDVPCMLWSPAPPDSSSTVLC